MIKQKLILQNETEETKNQVHRHFSYLLVCPFSAAGRWNPEIPDIGRLFRVVRICRNCIMAVGNCPNHSGLRIHQRT